MPSRVHGWSFQLNTFQLEPPVHGIDTHANVILPNPETDKHWVRAIDTHLRRQSASSELDRQNVIVAGQSVVAFVQVATGGAR